MTGSIKAVALVAVLMTLVLWASPRPAAAASPGGVICGLGGWVSGLVGKACTLATHAGRIIQAGKKLKNGKIGGAIGALSGAAPAVSRAVGIATIAAAAVGGARYALRATAGLIGLSTEPDLGSSWFSAFYWRMAAISALLTLPFLFAAAVQAIVHADLALLVRAAFGYLPLAALAIGVATPVTMLLLAVSDEMSSVVASTAGDAAATHGALFTGFLTALSGSLLLEFLVGLMTMVATLALWVELAIRQAAVYVIVLMLPLFFAAVVWPARRIWAVRAVEMLVALILSKFVIVAVLALGGAALGHSVLPGPASAVTGVTLVLLATLSPWALMRLLPLQELAGAAAAGLSGPGRGSVVDSFNRADSGSDRSADAAEIVKGRAQEASAGDPAAGSATATASEAAARTVAAAGGEDAVVGGEGAVAAESEAGSARAGDPTTAPGATNGNGAAGERLPGMPAAFQARNYEWEPLDLYEGTAPDEDGADDVPIRDDVPIGDEAERLWLNTGDEPEPPPPAEEQR